ncbi:MAG TPA: hypothetical protein VEJ20_00530 [Candidatus Eremiobacteraceae bacterium]|nr:hypothetical protein [Candidatus Eremiobacteraceae bacterium]
MYERRDQDERHRERGERIRFAFGEERRPFVGIAHVVVRLRSLKSDALAARFEKKGSTIKVDRYRTYRVGKDVAVDLKIDRSAR